MCLREQTDVNSYPESGVGYKVFVKLDPNLYRGAYRMKTYVRDQEYVASNDNLWDDNDEFYPAGFHIFPELESAQNLLKFCRKYYPVRNTLIVRVSYRELHTCGYEQKLDLVKLPVIVAKYMTLLEEIETPC